MPSSTRYACRRLFTAVLINQSTVEPPSSGVLDSATMITPRTRSTVIARVPPVPLPHQFSVRLM